MELKFYEMSIVNVCKLLVHPLLAAGMLILFGVSGQMLLMGILLAGMPSAALACVLAESYNVCEAETSATVLISMLLYIPSMLLTLLIAEHFGLTIG